jgi:hypothetical protein
MKNLIIIFSFLVCSASAQNITDSLLLYYPMNGNANDLSGNNFHGTASGVTSVPDRYGVPNSAYYFDGVNDYIDFPLSNVLKPDFPITISMWAKLKTLQIHKSKLVATDFVQNDYHGVRIAVSSDGRIHVSLGGGIGGCNSANSIGHKTIHEMALDTGIWYQITTVLRSEYDVEVWIDCNNAYASYDNGNGPSIVGYSTYAAGTLGRIDNSTTLPPRYNWGYMDELAYWERALSAAEIYTLCDSLPLMSSAPSWDCINNACIDPGNGSGFYTSLSSCQSSCGTTSLDEFNVERKLLRIVDVLGRNAKKASNVPLFYFYDDGTVEKRINIY